MNEKKYVCTVTCYLSERKHMYEVGQITSFKDDENVPPYFVCIEKEEIVNEEMPEPKKEEPKEEELKEEVKEEPQKLEKEEPQELGKEEIEYKDDILKPKIRKPKLVGD